MALNGSVFLELASALAHSPEWTQWALIVWASLLFVVGVIALVYIELKA